MKPAQAPSPPRDRIAGLDPVYRVLLACSGAMLVAALGLPGLLEHRSTITDYFFVTDTAWLMGLAVFLALTGLAVFLGLAAAVAVPAGLGQWMRLAHAPGRGIAIVAILVSAAALIGTYAVFHDVPLSYDEVMADFDARIFLGGRLTAPLGPEWRHSVAALAPSFVLPVPNDAAWVSAYLPVNAAFRAVFALVATPALTGPVLVAVAVLALSGIARHLWPDRPDAAVVAALMLATSPQVLVTAMTPYAMTAHLALNLVWLRLFLRGGRLGHAGAIAVGFLACGLHQIVFHPLFAAPVLLGLTIARRWRLSALYLAAYALIGAFWTLYPQGVLSFSGLAASDADMGSGLGTMAGRLVLLLHAFDRHGLDVMAMNLVRFVAWQSPLLLPLVCLALPAIWRGAPLMRALAGGIVLTVLTMFVLLPFQGHGWGYRYLHGLIGSACLLAAQGWVDLTRASEPRMRAAAAAILGFGWVFAALVLIPGRVREAERFAAPSAGAVAAIARDPAGTIFVDAKAVLYGADLVRNDPYLRGGRAVVTVQGLDPARLAALCAKGDAAFFGPAEGARFGLNVPDAEPVPLPPACLVRPVRLP